MVATSHTIAEGALREGPRPDGGAPVSVELVDGGVTVEHRGQKTDLHPMWLRERSTMASEVDAVNGQRLLEPLDLLADLAVVEASITTAGSNRSESSECLGLDITFSDSHRMRLPLTELAEALAEASVEEPPAPTPWWAADTGVPRIDYRRLAGSDRVDAAAAMGEALRAHFELGFFVLEQTPAAPGALHEITSHFGRISPTNFGALFDVRTEPLAIDLAYTPVALSAHTDQPYRAPTPGLQFLHTIVNDAPGGASTMVDGLAAADELACVDPEAHGVLCSLPVEFRYDIGSDVKVRRAPMIDRSDDGAFRQLRFSPRLDFASLADRSTLDAYYRGRRWLAEALNDPARQIEHRMKAGDTLVVDNHRVLHGRTSFDPTQGHRHLQGCYIDHDGPITAWILAQRSLGQANAEHGKRQNP